MYVQPGERSYAIEQLREIGNEDAVGALLARFEQTAPNHTTDADEKQFVYEVLVDLGRRGEADVVGVITTYLKRVEEKINWPLKVLTDLLSLDDMVQVVVELLQGTSVDYTLNPEKKQELMLRAAEFSNPALAEEVARFVEDDNETIRFLAVDALLAQNEDELALQALTPRLTREDSLRILQKLAEAFAERPAWSIAEDQREAVAQALPRGFSLDGEGLVVAGR
ncbi:hypothetical protein DL240_18315 [Lujinxingia litoralis]|uniref:HEAT repeat domain-containing protein n=2 Tax=Lujinxingia litoralis TaxID=2211119 RepID=A0A328C186_9DELT|nr:hypothetical protein DL240_18315 [Lujinxingia litoralis]